MLVALCFDIFLLLFYCFQYQVIVLDKESIYVQRLTNQALLFFYVPQLISMNSLKSIDSILHMLELIEVTKVLTKISKINGCKAITEWIKPCTSHLYWSARTTHDGNGEVVWAKFSSFLGHVVDKHDNLENPLFNKCGHNEMIQPRKWLEEGTALHHNPKLLF